jgi:hypothetical protein
MELTVERRGKSRYHLLTRVDILVPCDGQGFWGMLNNISWTGASLCVRQFLKQGQMVTIRFRFHDIDGREVTESLAAKVIWRHGDNVGLEFDPPLAAGSSALQQAPFLVVHLMLKNA